MVSTSSDGRMRYHAVELMRLMIGQIAEVVKASHFWDRFAMRVPRMREELRAHHDSFLNEIRKAFPNTGPPESLREGAGTACDKIDSYRWDED